jgi:hypothetical protein
VIAEFAHSLCKGLIALALRVTTLIAKIVNEREQKMCTWKLAEKLGNCTKVRDIVETVQTQMREMLNCKKHIG